MTRLTAMPTDGTAVYFCPTCTAAYTTQKEALGCAKRYGKPIKHKPGDILLGHDHYGWHDGAEHWHRANDTEFQGRPFRELNFFWVVTAVFPRIEVDRGGRHFNAQPQEAHALVVSVHSLGICNGMEGGRRGWRSAEAFDVVKDVPAKVRREAKALVGPKYTGMV